MKQSQPVGRARKTFQMNPYTKKLDINRCSEAELLALDGVGAELAAAIIARRPYGSVLGVRSIPGMTARTYQALKACLHVEHRPPAEKLNLNTASLRELLLVPEMTAEAAERILMLRPFAGVLDLKWVPEVSSEQLAVFVDWLWRAIVRAIPGRQRALRWAARMLPGMAPMMAKSGAIAIRLW